MVIKKRKNMNVSYHFAPIRVYSGAKSNKKTRAITEFVKDMFDRKSYDSNYTNREAILEAVRKECELIDCKNAGKGHFSVDALNTGEWDDNRDWRLRVLYVKNKGESIQVCDILCFNTKGSILDKTVDYASQTLGECIRKKYGII